ncbi:MAG TPA: protein kinase [Chthoniobacterales bacterium]|nr:protein kinase [Chthoniobacterales bacterium]
MRHFSPGLSDSIASVIADPAQCPHCDSSSHIAGGLCVGCLLQAGLDPDDECAPETLASAFAEVPLPDKNWRLGNYEILEEIGRGGMGVIYRARQRHSRRIVAVKRVLGYHADSRETLARFRREAQAAASLDHPNILPIYEVSQSEDGLPFFSMKFAPGGSLQEVGRALKDDPRQCVALVAKIARAVQHAHGKGILHRDLKPGNILLDAHGEPLVSDFGLAKWLDATSDLTRTLTIFGTPGYIAPEQASGPADELKPAADVYSLGAILFDLLTGRPPFLGSHALSVLRQAAESPAPKLRTLSRIADRDLETICAHCLERELSARYRSAYDLAEDLERWLEGRPIIARPVAAPVRVWRWSRRNPKLAGSLAAFVIAATAAVTWETKGRNLRIALHQDRMAAHSIAVLPFLNLDEPKDEVEFGNAVTSALSDAMTKLGPAHVASFPTSGRSFVSAATIQDLKESARYCGARSVLSGTVRKINGKTRVSFRLQDAANSHVLINRVIEDEQPVSTISSSYRSIASDLYSVLNLNDLSAAVLSDPDPAVKNSTATDFLIAGRELERHRTTIDSDRAIECFRNAFRAEPRSATARAEFVMAVMSRIRQDAASTELLLEAEREADEAIRLNPNLGQAHRARAALSYHKNNIPAALEDVIRAIELDGPQERPALFMGTLARASGEPQRALLWYEIAKRWQRRPANNEFIIGDCLMDLRRDDEAAAVYKRVLQFHPELPEGWMGMCRLQLLQGAVPEARTTYLSNRDRYKDFAYTDQIGAQVEFFGRDFMAAEALYAELVGRDPDGGGEFYGALSFKSALGRIRMLLGHEVEGRAMLLACLAKENVKLASAPNDASLLYRIAAIEASLDHKDAALNHLETAFRKGWLDYRSTALDPRFDNIRNSERYRKAFEAIVTKVASLK